MGSFPSYAKCASRVIKKRNVCTIRLKAWLVPFLAIPPSRSCLLLDKTDSLLSLSFSCSVKSAVTQPWKFHASKCFITLGRFLNVTRSRSILFRRNEERRISIDLGEANKKQTNRSLSSKSFRIKKSSYLYVICLRYSIRCIWLRFYREIW